MIVQTGNFTVSGRDFAVQVTSGTYEAPLHLHQHAQVVYAEEGTLEISDGQRAETLTAGSFAYILPFQVHALRTPASAHFRLGSSHRAGIGAFRPDRPAQNCPPGVQD